MMMFSAHDNAFMMPVWHTDLTDLIGTQYVPMRSISEKATRITVSTEDELFHDW